jgi:hypothetical protein
LSLEKRLIKDVALGNLQATERSSVKIFSALNLVLGMIQAPFQVRFLTTLGAKKPCQVKFSSVLAVAPTLT